MGIRKCFSRFSQRQFGFFLAREGGRQHHTNNEDPRVRENGLKLFLWNEREGLDDNNKYKLQNMNIFL